MKHLAGWLAFLLIPSAAAAGVQEIQTPYGALQALEMPSDGVPMYALTWGGQTLAKMEANTLSMYRVTAPAGGPAYVIVAKDLSGLNCRHEYALVKVTAAGAASVSNSFGNCMELAGARMLSDGVAVSLKSPDLEGRRPDSEEWTWQDGVLRKSSVATAFLPYVNNKYSFSVDYPASFTGHGEPDAGDGQVFTSPGNDAQLTASAQYCGEDLYTPARFLDDHKQEQQAGKLTITYSRVTKNFAVVSGTMGSRIFYDKLVFNGVQCAKFSLEYEVAQKATYDAAIGHIAASLKQWQD